jgi:sialate O-acetylesterase
VKRIVACLAVLVMGAVAARADVRVSTLFGDNLVLQREIAAPVWGVADPGEKVTVKIGSTQATAEADAQGKWTVRLPAMKANAVPQDLSIQGKNTLTIKNVLVGDVWVCSGQSNMEMGLGGCNAPADVASADLPTLRRIKFDQHRRAGPLAGLLAANGRGLHRRGVLFRPADPEGNRPADRPGRRQLGRHADRAVDPAVRV